MAYLSYPLRHIYLRPKITNMMLYDPYVNIYEIFFWHIPVSCITFSLIFRKLDVAIAWKFPSGCIIQDPTEFDRILEMKKASRAAGIGKASGPKPRQKTSDITDFQKKIWKTQFSDPDPLKRKKSETNVYKSM